MVAELDLYANLVSILLQSRGTQNQESVLICYMGCKSHHVAYKFAYTMHVRAPMHLMKRHMIVHRIKHEIQECSDHGF